MNTLEFLHQSDIFSGLTTKQLQEIAEASKNISLEADQYIIREGELNNYIYLIKKGEVQIIKNVQRFLSRRVTLK